jgi:hypothetical protein
MLVPRIMRVGLQRWSLRQRSKLGMGQSFEANRLANPSNGILVPNFYNNPHDTALPEVFMLLEELNEEKDVRPMSES